MQLMREHSYETASLMPLSPLSSDLGSTDSRDERQTLARFREETVHLASLCHMTDSCDEDKV